jgi:hypothetical protein
MHLRFSGGMGHLIQTGYGLPGFGSRKGQEYSLRHYILTVPGLCPVRTVGFPNGVKKLERGAAAHLSLVYYAAPSLHRRTRK